MFVHWKSLISLGLAFWGLLCFTDLLGDSSWKKHSPHLEDILNGHYKIMEKIQTNQVLEEKETTNKWSNWSILLWNICAFLCSLIFFSVIRSASWIIWKVFKIYNFIKQKHFNDTQNEKTESETNNTQKSKPNCKVLFKNTMFTPTEKHKYLQDPENSETNSDVLQETSKLALQLEETKKAKEQLSQQLHVAEKENLSARQQIEEFKLENFMMKEKLARTASVLKEKLQVNQITPASQEFLARKAHSLEMHLKEVCKDREVLRTKLINLEKTYSLLEQRLRAYEEEDQESENGLMLKPEKDIADETPSKNADLEIEMTEPDVDMSQFQQKIMQLQRNIDGFGDSKPQHFQANSKISVDLEESTSIEEAIKDEEIIPRSPKKFVQKQPQRDDINQVKQNLMNYNAYKVQMMRPKLRLSNMTPNSNTYVTDTTGSGSSSDENTGGGGGPQRIISSTVEFQNFLKTLTSKSSTSVNFTRSVY